MGAIVENCGSAKELGPNQTPVNLTNSLKMERDKLQRKLDAVNKTIALIESQPEIQKTLDALTELGRLRTY